jgi:hypothetical protein
VDLEVGDDRQIRICFAGTERRDRIGDGQRSDLRCLVEEAPSHLPAHDAVHAKSRRFEHS